MTGTLTLRTLERHCVLGPRLPLPEKDPIGALCGSNYAHEWYAPAPFKPDGRQRKPLRSRGRRQSLGGMKSFVFESALQDDVDFLLKTSPYVKEVRGFVPVFMSPEARANDEPDIVLERVIAVELLTQRGAYHFHVVATKVLPPWTIDVVHGLEVTTEVFALEDFSLVERQNARRLYACLKQFRNVDDLAEGAWYLAQSLRRDRRSDWILLERLDALSVPGAAERLTETARDRRLRIGTAYQFLCAAIVLGFLRLDARYPLRLERKLQLLPMKDSHHG